MKKIKVTYVLNTIFSGLIAVFISTFFAGGTVAENYTDETWVAPEFFVILPIWFLGFLLGLFIFKSKNPGMILFISILITWASIPLGVKLGFSLTT
ncbi:hypothetical protein JMA_08870 [Jeotgalibacillus malaysiensis]|uniref:Uncharacterized protein n=1 Tax=Jeotgalibacillus malaysiensis TaxID=1508404 RepID=A0A0B5AQ32_9BACL|nr:hypothetical protein [Jeotgalibacillus malaysiensis]AJD90204.1 hypothetical protein JMA_08870 [Jeotgalibacillus malaysiensis]